MSTAAAAASATTSVFHANASTSATMATQRAKHALLRTGKLFKDVSTPCYIPPTICGSVPHLTPDNCKKLPDLTTQMINFADIFTSLDFVKKTKSDFRTFMNTQDYRLLLSARDYIDDSNPATSKAGNAIETPRGRKLVTSKDLMDVASLMKPELILPLADEINSSFGNNRQRSAVQSSLDWLDECLALERPEGTGICGVIVGGNDERLRLMSAAETCKRAVDAVIISGLDTCSDAAKRQQLLGVVMDAVSPSAIPRLMSGIGHPTDVLDAIASGVDGFVSTYPADLTKECSALVFWLDAEHDDVPECVKEREQSGSVLHLRETRFEKDFRPILHGCDCFACKHYTRAYVHHLLNVREMLGDILVYMHNMHQYYRFFRVVRESIDAGRFEEFKAAFDAKFVEKPSQAPPLAVPLAIKERRKERDEEVEKERKHQQTEKAKKAAEHAAKQKAAAAKRKRSESQDAAE
ncbi:TPA: hypothetical protein N0F65_012670 [Lagenidium giganteum]|uniref:Queuine tRNA-ribosyltransferase accessory subunit 2 n=1 Tax=Lagenidium giganteum TaxID=4803 RepID=A0AAV2YIA8_9STRA|nr:TPA: hypothetical protein N0F65_012670 [Lagenidium giganteum]